MPESMEPIRKSLKLPGGELSCLCWEQAGREAPALVFTHATGFNAFTYRRLLSPLADRLRIYAPDMQGHGFSPARMAVERFRSWNLYRDDLAALARFVGEPVHLAGHSMGGTVSVKLAAKEPDRVKSLTLLDPVMFPPKLLLAVRAARSVGLRDVFPPASLAKKRKIVWNSREEMLQSYRGRAIFATWPDRVLVDYLEGGVRDRADGRVELRCSKTWETATFANISVNVWREALGVRCPVTAIRGGRTDTFLPSAARRFLRTIPHARLVEVETATHFVPMEFPGIVREEILRNAGA